MPCTPEMLERAVECASGFKLVSFTASPLQPKPGQPVTLKWNIDNLVRCHGTFKLNGVTIPMDGTKVVYPLSDTTYSIAVSTTCNVNRTLGRVLVDVNEMTCRMISIPETLVRSQIISAVNKSIQDYNATTTNDLSKRTETKIEIDAHGIDIKLRLKAVVNNFPDPDLNVDMKIGMGVAPGNAVSVFYKSFSVDVDWPFWVTGLTLGISKIVEEIVEGHINGKIKNQILDSLRTQVTQVAKQLPGVLAEVQLQQDELKLKVCG